jgi:hypothetical protein
MEERAGGGPRGGEGGESEGLWATDPRDDVAPTGVRRAGRALAGAGLEDEDAAELVGGPVPDDAGDGAAEAAAVAGADEEEAVLGREERVAADAAAAPLGVDEAEVPWIW